MNIYLNHDSFNDITDFESETIQHLIIGLASSLRILSLNSNSNNVVLKGSFDIHLDKIKDTKTLVDLIRMTNDKDAKGIILARLANYQRLDALLGQDFIFSLSMFSHEQWEEITTPIQDNIPELENTKNISNLKYNGLQKTLSRAIILLDFLTESNYDVLNCDYISKFYSPDFERNFIALCRTSDDSKRGVIQSASELILKLSHYTKNNQVTRMNNRPIYHNEVKRMYISPDYLHGTLELCDERGKHQGEINYLGDITGKADAAGNHDIRIG